jgi:quinol monooxygenase YgiN
MQKQVLINYMINAGQVDENISLIKNVFAQLNAVKLTGIKYSVYKMGENVFVHIAQFENEEAEKKFAQLGSFMAFRKDIAARQREKPVTNNIEEIGSFSTMH